MEKIRPNPDELLKTLQNVGQDDGQGHLKIFFGYAAGVGKTYAMLEAAHAAKSKGIDVVVGYIEPHSRPETADLLEGLEILPTLSFSHNDITLQEVNLEAALKRAPGLILVDELAHTNAVGSRHKKRYQDIEELLRAGINVYTTVNVQHIESLCDLVASITGITVHERIPDKVFDGAFQVELVDIEPQDLLERLKEGKIYKEKQARYALSNFFAETNLTALREIALRRCADRVNNRVENERIQKGGDYHTNENILVGLSSSPTNPKIIRTAARMAKAFHGRFTALFVETSSFANMSREDKKRLQDNTRLAEHLGASIETTYGDDVARQIAEYARICGASKVVVGRFNAKQSGLFGTPNLTEQLITYAPNLDVYIIPDKRILNYVPRKATAKGEPIRWQDWLKSIGCMATATGIGFLFFSQGFGEANIITIYILSILLIAVSTSGRIYSMVMSVVGVLIFNFFFTEPRYSLNVYDSGYPVTFLVMFLAAFITSGLARRLKQQGLQATKNAYRTQLMFEANQALQKAQGRNDIIAVTAEQIIKLLHRNLVFYQVEEGFVSPPNFFPCSQEESSAEYLTDNEQSVAAWVIKNNKRAGASTDTLSSAYCLYLAIRINTCVYGAIGIGMEAGPLGTGENSMLMSILGECALALENEKTAREKEAVAIIAKNEQLRANLLRTISHDLRTPLTSISGNANILLTNGGALTEEQKCRLCGDIYDDSLWLINLVENLLSVTRLEAGSMHLRRQPELMDDIIAEALKHLARDKDKHDITVEQSKSLAMVKVDARLIVQVIINVVDNAIKYTPSGSHIIIRNFVRDKKVITEVADDGPGISAEAKLRIFDMFYTANAGVADSRRSMGLGLALCKSVINVHGGEIAVCDNKPKGTIFSFSLPEEEVSLYE